MGRLNDETLSGKQLQFAIEYMKDHNASQACIRAGYKNGKMASYLMALPKVQAKIKEIENEIIASELVTVEYILSGLTEVVDRCLAKKPAMEWNDIKHCRTQIKDENNNLVWCFDANGANKALELLGKYIGIFRNDNQQRVNQDNSKAELTNEQFNKLLEAATKASETVIYTKSKENVDTQAS